MFWCEWPDGMPEANVMGEFGVEDVNDNERKVLDMPTHTGMCIV